MSYPEWLDPVEREIIDRVIDLALAADYSISVYDGEEYGVKYSKDKAAIIPEIAATDETTLRLRSDTQVGYIYLIHGNGCDVLSDYSTCLDELLVPAIELAEEYSH
jgi:hypothetical protein